MVIAPIVVGLVYTKCFDLNLLNIYLLLTASMGFCGVFSSLLHFMLPRKRPVEGEVVEDDTSDRESLLKKHRIGSLISSSATKTTTTTATATENDGNKSGDMSSNGGSISNSISSDHSVVRDIPLGDGNPQDIDEDLHSRQLAVYGRETMRRLFASNILVSGMQGLGAEIGMKIHYFFYTSFRIVFFGKLVNVFRIE